MATFSEAGDFGCVASPGNQPGRGLPEAETWRRFRQAAISGAWRVPEINLVEVCHDQGGREATQAAIELLS